MGAYYERCTTMSTKKQEIFYMFKSGNYSVEKMEGELSEIITPLLPTITDLLNKKKEHIVSSKGQPVEGCPVLLL